MANKLRIGVLMGGKSIEREVSFNSGRTICDHLDTQRYSIIPIFQTESGELYLLPPHFLHRGKISDFYARLTHEAELVSWDKLKTVVDFVYLAVHGRYGEDGTIQGMLEVIGIPYLGAKVFGSALGMDKTMQKMLLKAHGIDVALGITLSEHEIATATEHSLASRLKEEKLSYPLIIKPVHEGSSLGISNVTSSNELLPALKAAMKVDERRTQSVLIEEKLDGKEFVCVTLERVGHETREWFALPLTEVVIESDSQFFDYEQKYMPGRALKVTPARFDEEDHQRIKDVCKKASELLQFSTISRIDGFLTSDKRVVLIDPNSLTGMSPSTFLFNQAAEFGWSHTDLINFLIENELKSYRIIDTKNQEKSSMHKESNIPKIRVAVLLGGDSNEREISLESGRNVCYKLSPHKYEVMPVFVNDAMELFRIDQKLLIKNTTRAIAQLVTKEMQIEWSELPKLCDFVFIGLHGGKGENGSVQGALEMLDMPYNGPGVLSSSLCINKYKTNDFLRSNGFDVPQSILLTKSLWEGVGEKERNNFLQKLLASENLSLPVIVKPHDDGCSVMVGKAHNMDELIDILNTYFTTAKTTAMIEECIVGMELTVGVVGNENPHALPPSMAVSTGEILSMKEKFLPGAGENQTPAPISASATKLVQQTMVNAFKALKCEGYSRIDCFYQDAKQSPSKKERVIILEVNTVPALTPATCLFHQAAEVGIKPMDLIDQIVELGRERHAKQHLKISPVKKYDHEAAN